MQPVRQPAQLLQRSRELVLGAGDLLPGLLAGGEPSAAAQRVRQLPELAAPPPRAGDAPAAGVPHPVPQGSVDVDAASSTTRACTSARSRALRGRELGRGGDRLQQPRVLQHRRVVDEDGDRLALALHDGHRPPRTGIGEGEHAALGVDEPRPVGQPVADLKRRVAERP